MSAPEAPAAAHGTAQSAPASTHAASRRERAVVVSRGVYQQPFHFDSLPWRVLGFIGALPSWLLDTFIPIMMPDSPLRKCWNLWTLALVLYVAIDVPLQISFADWIQMLGIQILATITSASFCIDVIVHFRTAYITSQGEIVRVPYLIALHYLRGMFLLDLVSALPLDEMLHGTSFMKDSVWLGLLKLPRLFRLVRHVNALTRTKYVNLVGAGRLLGVMLLITHWSACLWHYLATRQPSWPWIFAMQCPGCSNLGEYLFAFYQCFLLMLGDRPGTYNNVERIFAVALLSLGACLYAVVVSSITMLVSNMWSMASRHKQRSAMLQDALRYKGASHRMRIRVDEYYNFMARFDHPGPDGVSLLNELPAALHAEVLSSVFERMLVKVQLFAYCERPFLWRLAQRLRLSLFMPGDTIYDVGSVGHDMYIIWKGAVGLNSPDGCMAALLTDNDHFGELGIMNISTPRPHRAVALRQCDIMILNLWDLQEACKDFPDSAQLVKGRARVQLEDHEAGPAVWAASLATGQTPRHELHPAVRKPSPNESPMPGAAAGASSHPTGNSPPDSDYDGSSGGAGGRGVAVTAPMALSLLRSASLGLRRSLRRSFGRSRASGFDHGVGAKALSGRGRRRPVAEATERGAGGGAGPAASETPEAAGRQASGAPCDMVTSLSRPSSPHSRCSGSEFLSFSRDDPDMLTWRDRGMTRADGAVSHAAGPGSRDSPRSGVHAATSRLQLPQHGSPYDSQDNHNLPHTQQQQPLLPGSMMVERFSDPRQLRQRGQVERGQVVPGRLAHVVTRDFGRASAPPEASTKAGGHHRFAAGGDASLRGRRNGGGEGSIHGSMEGGEGSVRGYRAGGDVSLRGLRLGSDMSIHSCRSRGDEPVPAYRIGDDGSVHGYRGESGSVPGFRAARDDGSVRGCRPGDDVSVHGCRTGGDGSVHGCRSGGDGSVRGCRAGGDGSVRGYRMNGDGSVRCAAFAGGGGSRAGGTGAYGAFSGGPRTRSSDGLEVMLDEVMRGEVAREQDPDRHPPPDLLVLQAQPFLGLDPLGPLFDDVAKAAASAAVSEQQRRSRMPFGLQVAATASGAEAYLGLPPYGATSGDHDTTRELVRPVGMRDLGKRVRRSSLRMSTSGMAAAGGRTSRLASDGGGGGGGGRPCRGQSVQGWLEDQAVAAGRDARYAALERQLKDAQRQLLAVFENPLKVPALASALRKEVDAVAAKLNEQMLAQLKKLQEMLHTMAGRTEDLSQQVFAAEERLQRLEEEKNLAFQPSASGMAAVMAAGMSNGGGGALSSGTVLDPLLDSREAADGSLIAPATSLVGPLGPQAPPPPVLLPLSTANVNASGRYAVDASRLLLARQPSMRHTRRLSALEYGTLPDSEPLIDGGAAPSPVVAAAAVAAAAAAAAGGGAGGGGVEAQPSQAMSPEDAVLLAATVQRAVGSTSRRRRSALELSLMSYSTLVAAAGQQVLQQPQQTQQRGSSLSQRPELIALDGGSGVSGAGAGGGPGSGEAAAASSGFQAASFRRSRSGRRGSWANPTASVGAAEVAAGSGAVAGDSGSGGGGSFHGVGGGGGGSVWMGTLGGPLSQEPEIRPVLPGEVAQDHDVRGQQVPLGSSRVRPGDPARDDGVATAAVTGVATTTTVRETCFADPRKSPHQVTSGGAISSRSSNSGGGDRRNGSVHGRGDGSTGGAGAEHGYRRSASSVLARPGSQPLLQSEANPRMGTISELEAFGSPRTTENNGLGET